MLPRITTAQHVHLPLEKLLVPSYYEDLFLAGGEESFNYPPESLICVRPRDCSDKRFEIVTGVELFRLLKREGHEIAPVLVTEMTAEEARLRATDYVLRTSAQSARRSVVQLIVAARDNEQAGGAWSVDRVTEQVGIKKSTYTHAWSSINYACLELKKMFPAETEGLGTTELVAMAVRRDFMPPFTSLYRGEMPVNKFYKEHYTLSDLSRERSRQQQEAKAKHAQEEKPAAVDTSAGNVVPLARPSASPSVANQLILEGFIKFAQALAHRRNEADVPANAAEEEVARLISDFIDKHQELEGELLRFSLLVSNRLKARMRNSAPSGAQGEAKKARKAVGRKQDPRLPFFDGVPLAV